MKNRCLPWTFLIMLCLANPTAFGAEIPNITGKPIIDAPKLLDWPTDQGTVIPNLNDPTSNTLSDFHANIASSEMVLSTEGNYHMALHDIWPIFLAKFKDQPLQNWFYTTSPPVALEQIKNQTLQVGNLYTTCRPSVIVATKKVVDQLIQDGYAEGAAYPLYQDRGVVILIKRGNPKQIHSVWDLGLKDVRLVTPNPELEPGAFENYARTIYNLAVNDSRPPKEMSPEKLIHLIFNGDSGDPDKWLAGARIHHRDLPWSVAYGKADAAVILYHLGLFTKQTFPDIFDLVPLGGTIDNPQPLQGTIVAIRYLIRIKGNWTSRQIEAREKLVQTLLSDDFTKILEKRGLVRPQEGGPSWSGG
jgi:Bacterial extracellular solute-binding protein